MTHKHTETKYCPVTATLELIGGKYKVLILWYLSKGTKRFSELSRYIPQATNKMLIQQLRELEKHKLITRKVYPVVPPRVEYNLTPLGKSIDTLMEEMYHWGNSYLKSHGVETDCDMYKRK